jgi:hypothetical protein
MFFGIRDPGSEIWDPGWEKTGIRDKHPGSATLGITQISQHCRKLVKTYFFLLVSFLKIHFKKLFLLVFTVKFLEVYAKKE